MSWISQNYEKAILSGVAVTALGLGYLGWQKLNSVEVDFAATARGRGPEDASVKGGDRVSMAISSFERPRLWTNAEDDGRPVDLFTGVSLFVNKNDPKNPVDLFKSADVHRPIPNLWWIENRIDPGFGDSPQRDEDGDGFSNLEEFKAKTDPNDNTSYPSLVNKLKYVGDESIEWVLRPGFPGGDGSFTFEYYDNKGVVARAGAANPILKDGLFFTEGPLKERFKYLGFEKKMQMNEKIQEELEVTIVKVQDMKPNKNNKVLEIPAQFRRALARQFANHDRTAVLTIEAIGLSNKEMRVEEFTEFRLPPGPTGKVFKLTKVTPESITIEETLEDGKNRIFDIQKGAVGPAVNNQE